MSAAAFDVAFAPARPDDVPRLLELMQAFYAEDGQALRAAEAERALRELIADERLGAIWLMRRAERACGYVVLTLGYSLEFLGRDAFVDELYVEPAERGRGLGRRALELLAEACRARSVRALHLEVQPDKLGARSLYRRSGFEERGHHLMTRPLA